MGTRILHKGDVAVAVAVEERDVFARFSGFVSGVCWRGMVVREMGMVRNVFFAVFATDERPAEATADGFDEVPGVEGVEEGPYAEAATFVAFVDAVKVEGLILTGRGKTLGFVVDTGKGVDTPGIRPEMQDTETGHFDTE